MSSNLLTHKGKLISKLLSITVKKGNGNNFQVIYKDGSVYITEETMQ